MQICNDNDLLIAVRLFSRSENIPVASERSLLLNGMYSALQLFHKSRIVRITVKLFGTGLGLFLLFLLLNILFPLHDRISYSTIITDDKGEVVHAFLSDDQKWRMQTTLEEISPLLRKTILAKEDQYFYYHPGVNPLAVIRAAGKNLFRMKRSSGASTITMQVARALEPRKRTYASKLIEMFRAFQLEWKYSKEEILQLYLNLAPYGGNIEGVKSASILYLNKNPDHLSLAEITALSIIPNRPSSLVPGKYNARIITERNKWLNRFAEQGLFTQKEIADALTEPFDAYRRAVPQRIPHLARKLKKEGTAIVHTGIDMNAQNKTETVVADYIRSMKLRGIQNAAVLVVDNSSRQVICYVGSASFTDTADGGQVNGAAAIRQPGSTLKPLVYGMAIDEGLLTPKRIIEDVAVNYAGYAPENYDRQFNGEVSMEYALEHSLNIPAVKTLRALGKERFLEEMIRCGFVQVGKDRKKLGLSLILGGCGASLEELTGLYTAFANDGLYTPLQYRKSGKADSNTKAGSHRILSAAANYMTTEILSRVNRPDFPLNWQSTEKMPKIAWKTGTSYGRRDAWSIGYNKRFTIGVWVGNFSAKGVPDLSGATIATPLLFRIFNTLDYDSDAFWYQQPEDCGIRQVCAETGLPPAAFCTHEVSDLFIPLVSGNQICENRKEIKISPDEKLSYCESCAPANGYKKKWYRLVSPEMQVYFEEKHMNWDRIPAHNPGCERVFRESGPAIISPRSGAEYLISKKNPEPLLLQCKTGNDVSRVYWYINNSFLKAADAGTRVFFVPEEGPVKISCTDDKGRNRDVWIRVRKVDW